MKEWQLEDLAKFRSKLRSTDRIAMEVTGNTRLFHCQGRYGGLSWQALAPPIESVIEFDQNVTSIFSYFERKGLDEGDVPKPVLTI